MRVIFAADHRGFALKCYLLAAARALGYETEDVGTFDEASCDYTDYGRKAAEAVARGDAERAVLICGTGIGMSILANKVPGIRASLCATAYAARLTRLHNDANVLCLSGDETGARYAREIMATWLATVFEAGRHERRLEKIRAVENDYGK